MRSAYYGILEGKRISFIGDSYFAGNGLDKNCVWTSLLAAKYDMAYGNYGINGSSVSSYGTPISPMVERYGELPDDFPDIVVFEGGRNDYIQQVPMGNADIPDKMTMKGAVRYLINGLREKYPHAVIIGITVWNYYTAAEEAEERLVRGRTLACSEYSRAMLDVCNRMGVPCINAADSSAMGIDMTDPAFRAEYCMAHDDRSHLNAEGMKRVFPSFERRIAEIYASALDKF